MLFLVYIIIWNCSSIQRNATIMYIVKQQLTPAKQANDDQLMHDSRAIKPLGILYHDTGVEYGSYIPCQHYRDGWQACIITKKQACTYVYKQAIQATNHTSL